MPRQRRVTLAEISRTLNLSTSSVSRALRDDPLIHPETRARVNAMALRMGYRGRPQGNRNSAGQRAIGVLFASASLHDVKGHAITMSYFQGMAAEADAAGAALSVHVVAGEETGGVPKEIPETLRPGIWITSGQHADARVGQLIRKAPLVSLVRTYPDVAHDLVSTDDFAGIARIVGQLAALGHRRCAWVDFDSSAPYVRARRAGFLSGLLCSGLAIHEQTWIENSFSKGKLVGAGSLLDAIRRGATAIVAASDHTAYEISQLLAREGIAVPGEVSVTGFDAIGEPGRQSLEFTSFDPNFVEMGRVAVRLALWRMENPSAASCQITVRGKLVPGQTAGPARASGAKLRRAG